MPATKFWIMETHEETNEKNQIMKNHEGSKNCEESNQKSQNGRRLNKLNRTELT